ncbi:hypothetical protein SAMN04487969_102467 [Paenibacillus algorifonticola]|uniref:Uncharacterized protein n=1 Tax=Paenibacillus algorifonticola TaxID=684063 RepID=A0A1I2AFG0_9BACL|nr:hypothetical protein [Paenibacillus algorifonticola]SFE42754.1 hypothetical protein SAMN04487969_102467 [Paenibacillus algorifonticola]
MRTGDIRFADLLAAEGLKSGMVFASPLMKGWEAARAVADFKAQENIRADHNRIIAAAKPGTVGHLVDRLATFYHSEYVKIHQPWVRETPFEEWRDRQLAGKGIVL